MLFNPFTREKSPKTEKRKRQALIPQEISVPANDASINDLFGPLTAGGQVHILGDELRILCVGMLKWRYPAWMRQLERNGWNIGTTD